MTIEVTDDDKFLFDLQGFLIFRGAIDRTLCDALLNAVIANEEKEHDNSWSRDFADGPGKHGPKDTNVDHQIRLNGLSRLDPVFDELIAHPAVLPYLNAFMISPQLVNAWSISKFKGCGNGGWHHGLPVEDYSVRGGEVRSPMTNVITMLTPNHPGDGCLAILPGSHKMNYEPDYARLGQSGLNHPGSVEVTGEPGDVLIFTEALSHTGTKKTTPGRRTNLQYNHAYLSRACPMSDTKNCLNYWMPPSIRSRFTPERKALTRWMGYTIPDRDYPQFDGWREQ